MTGRRQLEPGTPAHRIGVVLALGIVVFFAVVVMSLAAWIIVEIWRAIL
jgi:hypothetical protein